VRDVHDPVSISIENGVISAHNLKNELVTHIDKQGTAIFDTIQGSIEATSVSGDIIIKNSYKSVIAHTEYGNVKVSCAETPSSSTIDLKASTKGRVELSIPDNTQATITGNTCRGKILSTVPITLNCHTTTLTSRVYKNMPKQLSGIIGEQGDAEIKLSSARGIRITGRELTT
jgi:DUF4097 and DUF4098 domain-containing protein YvlB